MRFETFDCVGKVKIRKFQGTGQLLYKITNSIYVILTAAHHFVEFEEPSAEYPNGRINRIGDTDAHFLLQADGQDN